MRSLEVEHNITLIINPHPYNPSHGLSEIQLLDHSSRLNDLFVFMIYLLLTLQINGFPISSNSSSTRSRPERHMLTLASDKGAHAEKHKHNEVINLSNKTTFPYSRQWEIAFSKQVKCYCGSP